MSTTFSSVRAGPVFIARKREDDRSIERIRVHYEVECEIADRLRNSATWEERRAIFATMYDDLFARVPDHPRRAAKRADSEARERHLRWNLAQLAPYLRPGGTFLEIGAGDCALASRVAQQAKHVYAVDISDQVQG